MRVIFSSLVSFLLFLGVAYAEAREPVSLVRIIDGDTIVVRYHLKNEHVRLIGIDTPESKDNKRAHFVSKREGVDLDEMLSEGERAKSFVERELDEKEELSLELDVEARDRYGRLLAYVYLPNGEMLNELIMKAGYAYVLTVPPNVRYAERFLKEFRDARDKKRGLWGN